MNNNKIINNNNNKKITSITPSPPPPAAATNNNITRSNGTQACAACKYQRRKCVPHCILAPFFPHHRQRQFLNAHKLFGVSNITKIIRSLDQHDREQAMRTIIYQSDVRANDPVGGCYRIIRDLQRQIEFNRAELQLVLHQLAYWRAQNQFDNVNLLSNNSGSFNEIINADHNDNVLLHDQIQRPDDDRDQEEYILHGDDCEDQVHFEEINSWEVAESSATLVPEKSWDGAEKWQEDIIVKRISDERREGMKFEVEEKSFDSVNNFRLKTTPAN